MTAALTPEERNFCQAWATVARGHPDGDVADDGPVVLAATGSPSPAFNTAFVMDPDADPAEAIAKARAYFDARGLLFVIRFHGRAAALAAACEADGMSRLEDVPVMTMPMPEPSADRPAPDGLEVRAAADEAGFTESLAVLAASFGAPAGLLETAFTPGMLGEGFVALTGYVDGVPVACSGLVVTDDVAGVYNVGTVPEFRNRGIGEAMTWAALDRGRRRGCTTATLQSSPMGMSVYERMGFRTIADYRQYLSVTP